MSYKYYDQKLTYALADMLIYGYDFNSLKKPLYEIFENRKISLPQILQIELKYTGPEITSPLIQDFYNRGAIKSHEINEICKIINNKLISALQSKSTSLFNSLTRFYRFKSCIEIIFDNNLKSLNLKENSRVFKIIILLHKLEQFTAKLVLAIIKEFNIDFAGYCDSILARIITSGKTIYFENQLEKAKLTEQYEFLTLKNKEGIVRFFSCPEVKQILFRYFFPDGFPKNSITEITWDRLNLDIKAQKRRRIKHMNGKYENLYEVIHRYTTLEEFLDIIIRNDICAFYASIRTARKRLLATAIIDIDMSGFLRQLISPQILWEFTLTLSREIINTCLTFGLDKPLVVFSGKRGIHLLWRVTPDLIRDDYKYSSNFWEIFMLPAQKSLRKDPKSLIHSKFGLVKKIFEAILLHTAYNFDIEKIPDQIKVGLGVARVNDLFKLSPFSDNTVGILLDTSTMNGSVHRVFSFHFSNGRISIPITDPNTREIDPKYEDYATLLEESNPDTILENMKKGNTAQYFQFPTIITQAQIKKIFHPGLGLLPVIAIIVRFSDRWVTERSYYSYKFWIELFSITTFYEYLSNWLLILKPKDYSNEEIRQEIEQLIDSGRNFLKGPIKELVHMYFLNQLSFSSLKAKLDGFRNWEFFYRLKYNEIKKVSRYELVEFLEDKDKQKSFLFKFLKVYNIIQVWLTYYLAHIDTVSKKREGAIDNLLLRLKLVINQSLSYGGDTTLTDKELSEIDVVNIVCLYNTYISFLKEFFRFDRIIVKSNINEGIYERINR